MVITFENVSFKYIEKKLLNQVNFSVTDTDKVGIIGLNGCGKTTLLKLILGLEHPQEGKIYLSGGSIINYLPQDPKFDTNKTLLELVMTHETKDHPIAEYEAKSILSKLGLKDSSITTLHLSGGEKKRLALAIALVSYCDFLILDEPTNHLDNDMICWLEKFLLKWKHGLLMVTHDRYFLQRVCNRMLELEYGKVYLYDANYEKFLDLKAERLENTLKSQAKLKSILKKETEWLNRGVEARRTKSKSRIERIEALSKIEFNETKEMNFSSKTTYLGKKILELKNGSKAFKDKVLFQDFSFTLNRSDIIGIVGENGAGKTTLFKILMQEESLDSGQLVTGTTLKIGYFSQHLVLLDNEQRVIDYIKEVGSYIDSLDGQISVSDLLEQFLFDSTLQYSKIKMLSGGEKRRLQLVRVLSQNPNLLILDEPTNDLDIYTIEILEHYLDSFKGPILVVSHDRYFLDKICNKLFVFDHGRIIPYQMSFSEYLELEGEANSPVKKGVKPQKNKLPARIRNEYEHIQQEIESLEQQLVTIEEQLSHLTTEYLEMMDLNQQKEALSLKLDDLIERFVELEEMKKEYDS